MVLPVPFAYWGHNGGLDLLSPIEVPLGQKVRDDACRDHKAKKDPNVYKRRYLDIVHNEKIERWYPKKDPEGT